MSTGQKHPLRMLTVDEEQEVHCITIATSERLDLVQRARAALGVQAGRSFPAAAREAA